VSAQWDDSWLTADDRKAYRHPCRCSQCWPGLPALSVTPAPRPSPDRTAEIDTYVDSLVIDAEGLAIRALVRAVIVLLILAVTFGLIHALGVVIGLIIVSSLAGLARFIYLDTRRTN